jgi:hypothetical protein
LIYGSQRYGPRHPIRRRALPPRRRITLRKEVMRQNRRGARLAARQRRWLRPPLPDEIAHDEALIEQVNRFVEERERREAERNAMEARLRARLEAEREATLSRLRELAEAPSKRIRARAQRTLRPLKGA